MIVPDDQLSLAIGREGQNARLAAKLTGWRVDIVGESEFAEQADEDEGFENEEEVFDGRCSAVLSAGRRCPNAALPSSRYCGLPTHQALARFSTHQVTILVPLTEDEIAVLARPDASEDEIGPIVAHAEESFSEIEDDSAADVEVELEDGDEGPVEAAVEAEIDSEDEVVSDEAAIEEVLDETTDPEPAVEEPMEEIVAEEVEAAVAEDVSEAGVDADVLEAEADAEVIEEDAEQEVVEEAEELTEAAADESEQGSGT